MDCLERGANFFFLLTLTKPCIFDILQNQRTVNLNQVKLTVSCSILFILYSIVKNLQHETIRSSVPKKSLIDSITHVRSFSRQKTKILNTI